MKTAGDLLNDALDKYMPHAMECHVDTCLTCELNINRLRLAYKVWQNSDHQLVSDTLLKQHAAADLRLRKLEVLVGGTDIEGRIHALTTDQSIAWAAHGKLLAECEKLLARLEAAERRS